jgi:hypothetical protein
MTDRTPPEQPTTKDRLVTRPDGPLPTPEDPAGPHARGAPADPKPTPEGGQGTDPHVGDLDHTV